MNARRIGSLLLPLLVVGVLAATHPWFSRAFDGAVSALRLRVGQLGTELGLVPETGGLMLGIHRPEAPYSMGRTARMEEALGKPFDIIAFYQTWGDRPEDAFPSTLMRNTTRHGAMAMVTWEPWLSAFERNRDAVGVARRTDLGQIAGGAYDAYIRQWAREAAIYGQVFLLRFAHEANNPQYPWSLQAGNRAEDFIAAWRHVWTLFQEEGARNVVWVWSPHGQPPAELYPGRDFVDWLGVSIFNYGAYSDDGAWHTFDYLYDPVYRAALPYDLPIMIAELGTVALGGSQADWYAAALNRITTRYPQTRALVLFDNPADRTLPGAVIDWSVEDDPAVLEVFRRQVEAGMFLPR